MRFIIGIIVAVGLIVLLVVLLFGRGPAPAPNATKQMVSYAVTSTVVQYTDDYPLAAIKLLWMLNGVIRVLSSELKVMLIIPPLMRISYAHYRRQVLRMVNQILIFAMSGVYVRLATVIFTQFAMATTFHSVFGRPLVVISARSRVMPVLYGNYSSDRYLITMC
jgi:hypothetical protein